MTISLCVNCPYGGNMAYQLSGVMDTMEVSCETVFKMDHSVLAVNLNTDASVEAQLYWICPLQMSLAFNAHASSFGFNPYICTNKIYLLYLYIYLKIL